MEESSIGIFVLFGVLLFIYLLIKFELLLIKVLQGRDVPELHLKEAEEGFWNKMKATLFDGLLWKGVLYFLIKYVLGIFSFVTLVTLTSLSISLATSPIWILINRNVNTYDRYVAPFIEANPILIPAAMAVGLILVFASLHAFNGLALLHAKIAEGLLKRK